MLNRLRKIKAFFGTKKKNKPEHQQSPLLTDSLLRQPSNNEKTSDFVNPSLLNSRRLSQKSIRPAPRTNPFNNLSYSSQSLNIHTPSAKQHSSVLAMTFNIGDADISAMNPFSEFKKNSPIDNIFYKMMRLHFDKNIALPNIIVIGLQEVPDKDVTNITNRFETELKNIVNWNKENSGVTTDHEKQVCEEIKAKITKKQYKFCSFETNKSNQSTNYVKTCNFNFNILTMILYSTESITAGIIENKNIHSYCPTIFSSSGAYSNKIPTKGFVITKLEYMNRIPTDYIKGKPVGYEINKTNPIYIVNMHAPFKSESASKNFFSDLSLHMTNMGIKQIDNVIILGDYNSRSLLYNNEYVKNLDAKLCSSKNSNSNAKNYCHIKSNLEDLKFNDEHIDKNYLYNQIDKPYDYIDDNVIPQLTATNSFKTKTYMSLWGGILEEYPITFLPTYKRVTKKDYAKSLKKCRSQTKYDCNKTVKKPGEFELTVSSFPVHQMKYIAPDSMKTTVLRLPGYADRIMVAGSGIKLLPNHNMYTSLPVLGNDHIPVVASFKLEMN